MDNKRYSRTIQIVGANNFKKLQNIKIIVFGVGGVGGQALESLVRAGFLYITIVDRDVVEVSNLNRQLIATTQNIGKPKVEVARRRIHEINPECHINTEYAEINPENINEFNLEAYDYIVDAIDSFGPKMALIKYCLSRNLHIISAMGAGNRLDPTQMIVTDISKTNGCPLSKKVRYELRKEKLSGLMVVTSKELPLVNDGIKPGSSPFVPPASGLAIASYIFINVINK